MALALARCGGETERPRDAAQRAIVYIGFMASDSDERLETAGNRFAEAVSIMARLRGPDGCPWDREQSFDSIRKYTLEETYEVLDAIDRQNWPDLREELGDLLLQVLFYSQMATDAGHFDVAQVIEGLNRKLVRRHPHVFGDAASAAAGNAASAGMETAGIDANQVLRNWEQIKLAEKGRAEKAEAVPDAIPPSLLDSVPNSFPALMEAAKIGSKAAKVGFDWPDVEGVFEKLEEEIAELQEAIRHRGEASLTENYNKQDEDAIAGELGDLLFTTVNLARKLGVDPELALRGTNRKFRRRFAAMEKSSPLPLEEQSPDQLEALWAGAKDEETDFAAEAAG
jgi:nucleoside triphosphate diphosphatase